MKPFVARLLSIAIAVALFGCDVHAQESKDAYVDDFANVAGQLTTNLNGFYEDSTVDKTRYTFTYMGEDTVKGGDLVISILEDDETKGPDGKPGVLSLKYEDIPQTADYSGFVYHGRIDDPIRLPNFQGKVVDDHLKQVKISFQYKAANTRDDRVGGTYNCRFEVDVDDAYGNRIDFGELKATGKWKKFEQSLGRGLNRGKFINAVNANPKAAFKIVWGQEGEITNYDPNDELLIDDIKITVSK